MEPTLQEYMLKEAGLEKLTESGQNKSLFVRRGFILEDDFRMVFAPEGVDVYPGHYDPESGQYVLFSAQDGKAVVSVIEIKDRSANGNILLYHSPYLTSEESLVVLERLKALNSSDNFKPVEVKDFNPMKGDYPFVPNPIMENRIDAEQVLKLFLVYTPGDGSFPIEHKEWHQAVYQTTERFSELNFDFLFDTEKGYTFAIDLEFALRCFVEAEVLVSDGSKYRMKIPQDKFENELKRRFGKKNQDLLATLAEDLHWNMTIENS